MCFPSWKMSFSLWKSKFSARLAASQRQRFRLFIKPLDHSIQYQSFKWNAKELRIFNANKNTYENQFECQVYAHFWSPTFLETIRWFKVVLFHAFLIFTADFLFYLYAHLDTGKKSEIVNMFAGNRMLSFACYCSGVRKTWIKKQTIGKVLRWHGEYSLFIVTIMIIFY